jgi:uncharacterized protein YjdB
MYIMRKYTLFVILALSLVITACDEFFDFEVTGVTLDNSAMDIIAGDGEPLRAIITPSYATNKGLKWSSSDPAVARVSARGNLGTVTGVKAGTATITVTTTDGGKTAKCVVTVITGMPVTGVTLDPSVTDLTVGGKETLYAKVTPDNAANKKVRWSSSNTAVATVSTSVTGNFNTVTGVKVGTATITVTTEDGSKIATCAVTVGARVAVTGVTLDKSTLSLPVDGTENLYPVITPYNATNKEVKWSSDNTAVATVSADGNIGTVTGKSEGTATITVTTEDGSKTAACAVTVIAGSTGSVAVTGVTLNKTAVSINAGYTETLFETIVPANAANQNVTWSSNKPDVATVSDGTVTGVKAGTATVTVTTEDGGKTAACTVTVNALSIPESAPVQRVSFTGTETIVTLNLGSTNKEIYLVKVNTSNNAVSAGNTGGASGSTLSIASANTEPAPAEMLIRMGHPAADEYHANPPPFESKPQGRSALAVSASYSVNSTKSFWVESTYGSGTWVQKTATLKAQGTYGNIWVMNDLTSYTVAQAQEMAAKFDLIYPAETSLLGYEFGGGPSGDGGWDGDKRIQILVYDIGYNPSGTTLGYFWAKDMRIDVGFGQRSNAAEMFYLNGNPSVFSGFGAEALYSTLVHEFQHMINFSQKSLKHLLSSDTWYNEMLSMMAEDVISPLINITSSHARHPIKSRIPTFLNNYYLAGITEWGTSGNTLDSYSIAYAFGSYLLRNYGGASLLKEILANNSVNTASITAALRTVAGGGLSFEEALRRFGEAMLYSGSFPADVQSFDKTVAKTIGGYTYTAAGFNVWTGFGSTKPKTFGVNEQVNMRPYSLTVHQDSGWKSKSGSFSVTLRKPSDSSIEFYLMIK